MNNLFYRKIFNQKAAIVVLAAFCIFINNTYAAKKNIGLSITTHLGDEQTFREGDVVSFFVSLEKDAYLAILYQDSSGELKMILPNALHPDNFFKAGWFIPIPNQQNPFQFRITAPYGKETLWVFASDKPLPALELQTSISARQQNASLPGIRNTLQKYCASNHALLEEASLSITTTAATTGH
ncbi:DUF4384 domain-containing protein [Kaarinaea lacus]